MRRRLLSTHIRLAALVVLTSALALLGGCSPTPVPLAPFDYPIRVRDSGGATVRDAKATIEVPGRAPLDEFVDTNGLAVIRIPQVYVGQTGKLIVEAVGFETFRQNITLAAGQLPDEVRLTVAAVPPTPTQTNGPTEPPPSPNNALVTLPPEELRTAIALDTAGQVYVAWASQQSEVWDVFFVRSDDGGETFSAAIRPGAGQAPRGQPALAAGTGDVYLAWAEGVPDAQNIYYTRIAPNLSVSAPTLVSGNSTGSDHAHPSLAVGSQGTLYAVWQDRRNGNWDIYGTQLQVGGTAFEASRSVADAPGDQIGPVIATDHRDALYVAWTDLAADPDRIVYACGPWPNFATVVPMAGGLLENLANSQPALAIAPAGKAHLAWANAYVRHPTYGVPIYLPAYAATLGNACTPDEALPGSLQQVGSGYGHAAVRPPEPAVAATDAAVHVVLTTFSPRDGSYVWYYRASAGGGEFSEPVVLAHAEQVDVLHYPAIAVGANGALHVVWVRQHGEQWRAYYTQSTDGGRTFRPEIAVN